MLPLKSKMSQWGENEANTGNSNSYRHIFWPRIWLFCL